MKRKKKIKAFVIVNRRGKIVDRYDSMMAIYSDEAWAHTCVRINNIVSKEMVFVKECEIVIK